MRVLPHSGLAGIGQEIAAGHRANDPAAGDQIVNVCIEFGRQFDSGDLPGGNTPEQIKIGRMQNNTSCGKRSQRSDSIKSMIGVSISPRNVRMRSLM